MKPKKVTPELRKKQFPAAKALHAVPGPAIAKVGMAGGRMVPTIRLDLTDQPEVRELIRQHEFITDGDSYSSWGISKGKQQSILLLLEFIRPIEVEIAIIFDPISHSATIDLILESRAMYLEALEDGKSKSWLGDTRSILIEIPKSEMPFNWDQLHRKSVISSVKKSAKVSGKTAQEIAEKHISQWRDFSSHPLFSIVPKDTPSSES